MVFEANWRNGRRRKGLAPLEFVLSLPLFLFMLALMINFGYAAYWKVRVQVAARHAVWTTRRPRSSGIDPQKYTWPDNWPESASANTAGAGNLDLDDSALDEHFVVRGPFVMATSGQSFRVNVDLLDPNRRLRKGSAKIDRTMPFFPDQRRIGSFGFDVQQRILDDHWRHFETKQGSSKSLWANRSRRIPDIYSDMPDYPDLYAIYEAAAEELKRLSRGRSWSFIYHYDVQPLDDDDDFRNYNRYLGRVGRAPNFHPRLKRYCSTDIDLVRKLVEGGGGLIEKIEKVPDDMTRRFRELYEKILDDFDDPDTPDPPFDRAKIEENLASLSAP